ncbi:hypothetical protein BFL28_19680 [Sphingomonas turrisvirgatae]|uniref:TIGR00341 family protein n=1 Tax=Sphingomonas turrisvirgatae TaxID=1888892 RepID=A0A1E3LSL4_9SPHN|nr:hypothetical protein BFL28_19680 [Sphingomonas turrisvirgatae]
MWVVGGVDHDEVLRQIAEDSGWSGRYAFLILVSAAISLLGLLMPSVAVLIGAMLLSPLMMPIIGLGFGIATLDFTEIRRSATALLAGSAIAILLSVVLVSISPVQTITSEIAGRTQPTLFDLLVALLSAVAGAYALIRGRGGTVVGVAIAIALMPPLAVVGFGIATWNWTVFAGSLLLFITNAVTIALTAALVARVYGFGSHLSPHHTGWQLILFFVALGALSIPLGAGLRQIAFEAVAQRQIRDTIRSRFPAEARLSQLDIDYGATPIRIRGVMLTPRLDPEADASLTKALGQQLDRPIDLHVDQLQITLDPGAVEAAQIARAGNRQGEAERTAAEHAIGQLALIAGVAPDAVRGDPAARTLAATAAPLPGLTLDGYRTLERRASAAIPGWQVRLAPPAEIDPPALPIEGGVIDTAALDLAGWVSARLDRPLRVGGGTAAQRESVAAAIVARGGQAEVGEPAGALALAGPPAPTASLQP